MIQSIGPSSEIAQRPFLLTSLGCFGSNSDAREIAEYSDDKAASMKYELMQTSTGNIVGWYTSEEAALKDVMETIRLYGPEAVQGLALGVEDVTFQPRMVARGAQLADLAVSRFRQIS